MHAVYNQQQRGIFRRAHSSHSENMFNKDGLLNTLSVFETKNGIFGPAARGNEQVSMKIVGEVDQDNEADEENLTRRHKLRRKASIHDSEEQAITDVDARLNEVIKPGSGLPFIDSADREHLTNLKKQIEEIDGQEDGIDNN